MLNVNWVSCQFCKSLHMSLRGTGSITQQKNTTLEVVTGIEVFNRKAKHTLMDSLTDPSPATRHSICNALDYTETRKSREIEISGWISTLIY